MTQIATLKTRSITPARPLVLLLSVLFFCTTSTYSQSKLRTYANYQAIYETGLGVLGNPTLVGDVTSAASAVNLNPLAASTLSVPIGALNIATTTQYLEFTTDGTHANRRTIDAGTPVTIKIAIPKEILGLLTGISIGSFTGLTSQAGNWPTIAGGGNNAGSSSGSTVEYYSGNSLLNVLNGAGDAEITITPSGSYNGVYLRLSSLLSLGLSAQLYHAYILENGTYSTDYNKRIDALSGVREGISGLGVASATGSVANVGNVIDSDISSSYSLMSTGAQVLSEVFHTTVFERPSLSGDSVQVILQQPGTGLIDLSVLNGFSIQPYLDNTPVGAPINSSNTLLMLNLLGGAGNKYRISVPVAQPYNRVEIKLGGVANALSNLRIYDVSRVAALFTLPVSFTGLNAAVKSNRIEVKWNTQNESDIESYRIEKTLDGSSFKTIGLVFAKENGISNTYMFPDQNPVAGINRYRISTTNKDGSVKISSMISALYGTQRLVLKVNPNPVLDVIRVSLSDIEKGAYRLELLNVTGQLLTTKTIQVVQSNQVEIMSREKASMPGLYWLNIVDKNNRRINTVKVMAQ